MMGELLRVQDDEGAALAEVHWQKGARGELWSLHWHVVTRANAGCWKRERNWEVYPFPPETAITTLGNISSWPIKMERNGLLSLSQQNPSRTSSSQPDGCDMVGRSPDGAQCGHLPGVNEPKGTRAQVRGVRAPHNLTVPTLCSECQGGVETGLTAREPAGTAQPWGGTDDGASGCVYALGGH